MNIPLVIESFTSDDLSFKEAFTLSLKPLNVASDLIPRAAWIVVPPRLMADIPVNPSKTTLGYFGFL